jgi:hypothetical protein
MHSQIRNIRGATVLVHMVSFSGFRAVSAVSAAPLRPNLIPLRRKSAQRWDPTAEINAI